MKNTTGITAAAAVLDKGVRLVLRALAVAMFIVLLCILSLNILNRFVPLTSFHWLDEIVELCFAAMVFYGAAAVWIEKGHFSSGDWIGPRLPGPRSRAAYALLKEAAGLAFLGVLLFYSAQLALRAQETTAVFHIPKFVLYASMPVSAALMAAYSAVRCAAAVRDALGRCKEAQ